MPSERPIYQDGDFWLCKRRDGKSPDIWQIASYREKSRSVVYRSTKCRTVDLERAKAILHAYAADQRSKLPGQRADQSMLIPHFMHYCREHGNDVARLDTSKSSFRAIIGFLQQDELGVNAVVADVNKVTLARFRNWRMGPHEYEVEWGDKVYRHKSAGVSGEAVQRNLEDLRAALNHAEAAGRVEAPKVVMVPKELRSEPRDRILTFAEIGALWGYARADWPVWREICLIIGTSCRPGAAQEFDPATQWHGDTIDLLPPGKRRTKKRRAICPVIEPLRPILEGWRSMPHAKVKSRKTWWRHARKLTGVDAEAYAIRHTLLTYLDKVGVPGAQYSGLAGHIPPSRGTATTTAKNYLHYDPANAPELVAALTTFWNESWAAADQWCADHVRTKPIKGKPISLAKPA